jgi:SAM-dependent methyltransferase
MNARSAAANKPPKGKGKKKKQNSTNRPGRAPKPKRAETEDRHVLYELAVQCVEAEIDFVDDTFKDLRKRKIATLREDFAGTCNTSVEFVSRRKSNFAVGVDLDKPTLDWGADHNIADKLTAAQQKRIAQLHEDVLAVDGRQTLRDMGAPDADLGFDAILAMNFSYFILQQRDQLRRYFSRARDLLKPDGILFLDCYGGYESYSECEDERRIQPDKDAGVKPYNYVWDQARYNPISGEMDCKIHFTFDDGSEMRDAFLYTWRMWTMPEIREILAEAGFAKSTVYWEGADEDNPEEGNGEYSPTEEGDADPAWVCYIVAEK